MALTDTTRFKAELHLHTSDSSVCGMLSAAEMVDSYAERGYRTLVVSDHFYRALFDRNPGLSWGEGIDKLMLGYLRAREAAESRGISVIFSAEVELTCNKNHYLLYGEVEPFLRANERLFERSPEELCSLAHEAGLLVIQAHPLRDGACIPMPECVDGFEIYNSNPRHEDFSPEVERIARRHGKICTSGSDAHRPQDVGLGGITTSEPICSAEQLVSVLRSGEYGLIREAGKTYLISDLHGDSEAEGLCDYLAMAGEEDLLIILGDTLFGFEDESSAALTEKLIGADRRIAIMGGNHDNYPLLLSYPVETWCRGKVNRISENVVYLRRGEIYDIKGKLIFAFGGCKSSVAWRNAGNPVFDGEEPTDAELAYAKQKLAEIGNRVDFILTHKYEDGRSGTLTPTLAELTEFIEGSVEYKRWYYGHLHGEADTDGRHRMIYKRLRELI